ncbi:MAG: hypothetical protein CMH57_10715, partial [Myxococcales bacterium]|nr:hypothetical protein [Myxococcales bacterium]
RLGQVPNLQDFIAVADLVVAPPTSARVVPTLALDRPLLLVGGASEVANQTDFLLDQGCAWHTADILRLGADLEVALGPERLAGLAEAAGRVGRVTGSVEVADALALILERRAELQGRVDGDSGDDEPDSPRTSGPFELIGSRGGRPSAAPAAPTGPFEAIGGGGDGGGGFTLPPIGGGGGGEAPEPGPAPPARPDARASAPTASPLSAAQAKDELAALIMVERDLERKLTQAQRDQEQWYQRLELARQWNETELAVEAERRLHAHQNDAARFEEELERIRAQKDKLKSRVRASRGGGGPRPPRPEGPPSPVGPPSRSRPAPESRFRSMEVERDLSSLKERLRRELEGEED